MVEEETMTNDIDYRPMDDPFDEFQRAKSDYIHISKTYKNYFSAESYLEAEEKAWIRLQNALKDPNLEL